jgi:lipopolysaccharide export system permease protein
VSALARGIFLGHVLRAVAAQVLLVGAVLLAVLAIHQFSFVLGRAADGQIEGSMVPPLAAFSLRSNIGVILPFALLLGVVLGLGRLYYDSEITAARALGLGRGVLHAAAALLVLPAGLLAAWVAFIDGPAAARDAIALRVEALRTAAMRGLEAGGFRALGGGMTLHFGALDADGALREVFLQRDLPAIGDAPARMQVLLARRAGYRLEPDANAIVVELIDGRSYEGTPGALDWRLSSFRRQLLRLPVPDARLPGQSRVDTLGNRALLQAGGPRERAELHWRIGWVVAVLVLGLLAVPLAELAPRQGRHARLPPAILLFGIYAGLLISGRSLLERGESPAWLGLWWVHATVVLLGLAVCGWPWLWRRLVRLRSRAA